MAAKSLLKSDDLESNTVGIGEAEFVLAFVEEPGTFVSHAIEAPGAKPIGPGQPKRGLGAVFKSGCNYPRDEYLWFAFGGPIHT